jgi:hypothetical protein
VSTDTKLIVAAVSSLSAFILVGAVHAGMVERGPLWQKPVEAVNSARSSGLLGYSCHGYDHFVEDFRTEMSGSRDDPEVIELSDAEAEQAMREYNTDAYRCRKVASNSGRWSTSTDTNVAGWIFLGMTLFFGGAALRRRQEDDDE